MGNASVAVGPVGNGITGVSVTIGGIMSDHKKWELIQLFRNEFESADIKITKEDGRSISGVAEMKKRF